MKTADKFTEPISIIIFVCAKFHDSIPLLGKYWLCQKSKLLLYRDVFLINVKILLGGSLVSWGGRYIPGFSLLNETEWIITLYGVLVAT